MKDEERWAKERRKRNIALALMLAAVAVLFFLMSIVQWHEHSGQ
jgi:hypothetical protein